MVSSRKELFFFFKLSNRFHSRLRIFSLPPSIPPSVRDKPIPISQWLECVRVGWSLLLGSAGEICHEREGSFFPLTVCVCVCAGGQNLSFTSFLVLLCFFATALLPSFLPYASLWWRKKIVSGRTHSRLCLPPPEIASLFLWRDGDGGQGTGLVDSLLPLSLACQI